MLFEMLIVIEWNLYVLLIFVIWFKIKVIGMILLLRNFDMNVELF